jgi:hypothetical protein
MERLEVGKKNVAKMVASGLVAGCVLVLAAYVCSHGSNEVTGGRAAAEEILDMVAGIDSIRGSLLAEDGPAAGDRLDLLAEYWADLPWEIAHQLRCDRGASLGNVLVSEVDNLYSLLDAQGHRGATSGVGNEEGLERSLDGLSGITGLAPLIQAMADSSPSAMLVVSSVACRCVLARCTKMLELYAAITKDTPGAPLAYADIMQSGRIDGTLGIGQVPAWVYFDASGCVSKIAEGAGDIAEIRESLSDWIGTSE